MKIDADKLLNELEKDRIRNKIFWRIFKTSFNAGCAAAVEKIIEYVNQLIADEEQRAENQTNYKIDVDMYDEMELYTDCTVQVLHNTITDEYSVGWWQN